MAYRITEKEIILDFDARTVSPKEQEEIRKDAVDKVKNGLPLDQVAANEGVHIGTLRRWLRAEGQFGEKGLKSAQRGRKAGECTVLSAEQGRIIVTAIQRHTPDELGLPFFLWSIDALRAFCHGQMGTSVHPQTMRRFLNSNGYYFPNPKAFFMARNDVAVSIWFKNKLPKIHRGAKKAGAQIHWGYRMPSTPKVAFPYLVSWSNQGKCRFSTYQGDFCANALIHYFERLQREVGKKVCFIQYRFRIQDRNTLQNWLADNTNRFELYTLP